MPLKITIELVSPTGGAGHPLASAIVERVGDGKYEVNANEGDNHVAGHGMWWADGTIEGHDREQSVWSLVGRVAEWASEQAIRRNRPKPDAEPPATCGIK